MKKENADLWDRLGEIYSTVQKEGEVSMDTLIISGTWHLIALLRLGRDHEITMGFKAVMDKYRH